MFSTSTIPVKAFVSVVEPSNKSLTPTHIVCSICSPVQSHDILEYDNYVVPVIHEHKFLHEDIEWASNCGCGCWLVLMSLIIIHRWQYTPTDEELDNVREIFGEFTIPENFVATVTPYSEGAKINNRAGKQSQG